MLSLFFRVAISGYYDIELICILIVNTGSNLNASEDINNSDVSNPKDAFSDILGPNFNIESMVHETGKFHLV